MPKTINITWTQPTIGSPNDYALEYGVSGQALTSVTTGSASTSYQIDDLIDNEIYQLRIAGINSEGTGAYTPVVYHYASQYPSAPLALASGEPANSGDLLLTWNAPEFSETVITNYAISSTPDGGTTSLKNTTNTSYDLTNLDCTKNVNVTVTATNTNGDGPQIVADFVPYCGAPSPTTQPPSSNPASLLYDNTNGPLSVANNAAIQANGSMTLEGWVYISPSSPAANIYLFEKYKSSSSRGGYRFSCYNDTNTSTYNMRIYVGDDFNTSAFVSVPVALRPSPGVWTHYAAVIDDTATQELRLYQNGILVGQDTLDDLDDNTQDLFIGGQTASSATGIQSQALLRITKAVRYSANFTPSFDINDYLDGNDPLFSDVSLLITGNGKTDGDTVIVDESNNGLTITNLGNTEYDTNIFPGASSNIIVESDGTGRYDLTADISMDNLPAGAVGHKIMLDGDMDGNIFRGAELYIQNPQDNDPNSNYRTDDGSPNTNGGAPDNFTVFYRNGIIPPTSGYGGRDSYFIRTVAGYGFVGTLTIQPIDASNNPVGSISNTVNIELSEDG